MFKNKKETVKSITAILIFGVVGLIASAIVGIALPYAGAIPVVSFVILYVIIVINFILANNVVDNVKGYFIERFCKTFGTKHPKSNALNDELSFERAKLNEMVAEYNSLPAKTKEQIALKDKKFDSLQNQKIKYNNIFQKLSGFNKNDVQAFNKFNNLNNRFLPIIIKNRLANENIMLQSKEKVAGKQKVREQGKSSQSIAEKEQNVVIEPIGEDILNQLKDSKANSPSKHQETPKLTDKKSTAQQTKTKHK